VIWLIIAEIVAVWALVTVSTVMWFKWMDARHDRAFTELQERLNRGERSRGSRSAGAFSSPALLSISKPDCSRCSTTRWASCARALSGAFLRRRVRPRVQPDHPRWRIWRFVSAGWTTQRAEDRRADRGSIAGRPMRPCGAFVGGDLFMKSWPAGEGSLENE
jgi:hypothetical protein